jgi:hypothetical protein
MKITAATTNSSQTINALLKALRPYLQSLPIDANGWCRLDRDAASAALAINRRKLAQLLTKASSAWGTKVEADRFRFPTAAEVQAKKDLKPKILPQYRALAAVEALMARRAIETSQRGTPNGM